MVSSARLSSHADTATPLALLTDRDLPDWQPTSVTSTVVWSRRAG
jgi:hypothetical protein